MITYTKNATGLTCIKEAPTFEEGKTDALNVQKMQGRIYSPERDEKGKFVDKVGVQDDRVMVFSGFGTYRYHVFANIEEVNKHFKRA